MQRVLPALGAALLALLLVAAARPGAPAKARASKAPGAKAAPAVTHAALLQGARDTLFYPAVPFDRELNYETWHADVCFFTLLGPDGKTVKRPDGTPLARNVRLSRLLAIQDSLPGLESKSTVGQVIVRFDLGVRHDSVLGWGPPRVIKGDSVYQVAELASRRAEAAAERTLRLVRRSESRVPVHVNP